MGGRKSHHEKGGGGREQARKQPRGFARGHGAHHRHQAGKGAPRRIGSGRDRTEEGARRMNVSRLGEDELYDLSGMERKAEVEHRLEELAEAGGFGARMEGPRAAGTVIEVRKGNFLTQITSTEPESPGEPPRAWKVGDLIRTFVRGTMQQFDLGLSSLVAAGDEVEVIVPPLAGDKALFQHQLHAALTRVRPRRSEFRRLHPSGRSIQTIAANIGRVFIVASASEPDFRPGFVDRVLICAASSGLPASLIINKMDLGLKEKDRELLDVYRGLGVDVFPISVVAPENFAAEIERLKSALAGHRNVFTGHSGVGKSSLLRVLDPNVSHEIVRTGEVSAQTSKGTHTTTHARLFDVDLGAGLRAEIIDTPGVREFTPADTDRQNLWGWFPEIAKLQGQCAYADCTHTVEKGCAVLAAVERGEIHERRHHSYVRILQTMPN